MDLQNQLSMNLQINYYVNNDILLLTLRKIPKFHLISWCENFVERHSFRIVSGEMPETMRKLCLSAKLTHQQVR